MTLSDSDIRPVARWQVHMFWQWYVEYADLLDFVGKQINVVYVI